MKNISELVRPNILRLKPYSTARDEAGGATGVNTWLDANESPYGENGINRYPDPRQKALKKRLGSIIGIDTDRIFIGNGSDEAIDLMYRIFCAPEKDNAVAISPTYGMYGVAADINDIEYRPISLNTDFSIPVDKLLAATDERTKLMWVCSPNNPTGNSFPMKCLEDLAIRFNGILVIDEAYFDFTAEDTGALRLLKEHDNVVVLRTLSKAYGLASIRVGLAFASPFIIGLMDKVKYPYNVNALSQAKALEILENEALFHNRVNEIIRERQNLATAIRSIASIEDVYPSDANFILIKVADGRADEMYDHLKSNGILVRNRSKIAECKGTLRLTIGTPDENRLLIKTIQSFK